MLAKDVAAKLYTDVMAKHSPFQQWLLITQRPCLKCALKPRITHTSRYLESQVDQYRKRPHAKVAHHSLSAAHDGPLAWHYCIALLLCSIALQYCIAVLHCSIALQYCVAALQNCIAVLHAIIALHYCMALLHCIIETIIWSVAFPFFWEEAASKTVSKTTATATVMSRW